MPPPGYVTIRDQPAGGGEMTGVPPTFTDEGLRAAIAVRKRIPGLPVVVLSQYVEQLYAREPLSDHAGAVGYLLIAPPTPCSWSCAGASTRSSR